MITRILITILVYCFLGWLLCDIDPEKEYTWYSGIWHGMFFVVNLVRSWFTDTLYNIQLLTMSFIGFLVFYPFSAFCSEVLAAQEGITNNVKTQFLKKNKGIVIVSLNAIIILSRLITEQADPLTFSMIAKRSAGLLLANCSPKTSFSHFLIFSFSLLSELGVPSRGEKKRGFCLAVWGRLRIFAGGKIGNEVETGIKRHAD